MLFKVENPGYTIIYGAGVGTAGCRRKHRKKKRTGPSRYGRVQGSLPKRGAVRTRGIPHLGLEDGQ